MEQTKNQIGIASITRQTSRSLFSNGCSYFNLVAVAQRENNLAAVILIRNDSLLNNEWEAGYFLEGTTSIIFTNIQAYESILNQYGGSAEITQLSARILTAPDDGNAFYQKHNIITTTLLLV